MRAVLKNDGQGSDTPLDASAQGETGAARVLVEYRSADRRWVVRQVGSKRVTSLHSTRSDAERVARRLARKQRKDVAIISPDGALQRYIHATELRNRSQLIRSPRGDI